MPPSPSLKARSRWIRPTVTLALAGSLAAAVNGATVSWDGGGDGTSWSDPLNWSGDTVPGAADTAVLNVGSEPVVRISGTTVTVAALDCRETLEVVDGSLSVTGAATVRNHPLRIAGGTASAGSWLVIDGALEQTSGSLAGEVTLHRGRLELLGGTSPGVVFHLRGAGTLVGGLPADAVAAVEGTVTEGLAHWRVSGTWANRGTLRLTCLSNDLSDRGSSVEAPEGSVLHLLPGARLVAESGAGDGRRIDGSVLNEGVIEADAIALPVRGRVESRGGRYLGDVRFLESELHLTAAPGSETTLYLHGPSNRLLTGIPARTVLQVNGNTAHGLARLTLPVGTDNGGTIRMTCTVNDLSDRSAEVVVDSGTLTNLPSGRIEVLAGAGDWRRFSGSLRNEGAIEVEAGVELAVSGSGHVFTQAAGTLAASGGFVLESGTFRYTGGAPSGAVRGHNSRFEIGPGIAGPATLQAVGSQSTFAGNASPGVTLWVEGTTRWGLARLGVPADAANAGGILLRTSSNDLSDRSSHLAVSAGARLHNLPGGRIRAEAGLGDGRLISGDVLNEGILDAGDTAAEFAGVLESRGGRYLGDLRFRDTDLHLTASPAEPTTLSIRGTSNRLLTGIPADTVVHVGGDRSYGLARLVVPAGVANSGVLRMECLDNDLSDRSAEVWVQTGTFTNAPAGRIEVIRGAGDWRRFTGNLRNEGTIDIRPEITLEVLGPSGGPAPEFTQPAGLVDAGGAFYLESGTFDLAGGALAGTVRARNSQVTVGPAATGGELRVVGFENRLGRQESPAVSLWVEGTVHWGRARLRVPASTLSAGVLRLEASSDDLSDRSASVWVEPGAILTNAPTGTLRVGVGAGDGRTFSGRLWHQGALEVEAGTALEAVGRLDLDGGRVTGEVRVFDSEIATWRPASAPSTLSLLAAGNRLTGDVEAGYTLWIRGTANWGLARLTAATGFVNRGILRLETSNNDLSDRSSHLVVSAGVLHNAAGGRIESLPGAGDGRGIAAELRNDGLLVVATPTSLGRAGAVHASSGTVRLESDATLTVTGSRLDQASSGRLEGTGTLDVQALAFTTAGTTAPGASPGWITVRGPAAMGPGHTLDLEAAGTTPGTELDRLAVTGALRLDGRIRIGLAGGYVPVAGHVLEVLGYGAVRGTYSSLELPTPPDGLAWLPEYSGTGLSIRVIPAGDNTNRAPAIVSHPAPLTVVRRRTAEFTVTANGTAPLAYQWQRDGEDVPDATGPVLTLADVRPDQAGTYRVRITNPAGEVFSQGALLTVLETVGVAIPPGDAALTVPPSIPGDGVEVDVYNGIGGGRAPAFADLEGLAPTGSTPSPVVDFPRPAATISVGSSFNTFFADTTTPPASLSAVAAANFLLDHGFFLRVDPADDLHPDTPEVDLDLGVGSDDGFRLKVGSVELGSAGDRGFAYSWFTVSFPAGGLYPVRLLFAANAVGASGLEFAWRTARAGQQIVPQEALHRTVPLGDRLVTFDDLDAGTRPTTEYAAEGLVITALAGDPRVTAEDPTRLVPVSPPHVLAEPDPLATPFVVELRFVTPDGGFAAATDFVSLFILDAEEAGARVEAFDGTGARILDRELHGGAASREQVVISAPQIASVRITQLGADDPVGIDHVSFTTPVPLNLPPVLEPLADIAVDEGATVAFRASGSDPDAGQTVRFALRAGGPDGATIDPESGEFRWVTSEIHGPGEYPVTVVATDDGEPVLSDEQVVRITVRELNQPPTLQPYPLLYVSADGPLAVGSAAFDADLPPQPLTFALGPDAPAGMTVDPVTGTVAWTVDRTVAPGTYTTQVTVDDGQVPPLAASRPLTVIVDHDGPRVVAFSPEGEVGRVVTALDLTFDRGVSAASVSAGDFVLAGPEGPVVPHAIEFPEPGRIRLRVPALRRSGGYTFSAGPGILGLNRAPMNQDGDAVNGEAGEDAFTGGFRIALPDLVVSEVAGPSEASPGGTIAVTWRLANAGAAPAAGPWFEAVRLSADGVPGGDLTVADLRFDVPLAAGATLVRTQHVTLPFTGAAGDLRLVVAADATGTVEEESEGNNASVAASTIRIAPALSLQPARTSVAEGDPAFQVIVRRNGDLTAPLPVDLAADPAGELELPASVVLPAGQGSVTFTVTPRNDGVVDGDRAVRLRASAAGLLPGETAIVVRDVNVPLLRLELGVASVAEGGSATVTVRREPVTPGPLAVRLQSRNPAQLALPATVTLPDGAGSATFQVTPVDDTGVEDTATVDITAESDGFTAATLPVVILDNDAPSVVIEVSPSTFSEGAGPTAATATVTRRPAGTAPLRLALSSGSPGAARVPDTVTIPAGAASAGFPVAAVDDSAVDGTQTATLVAAWIDAATGRTFGEAARAVVEVTDDDVPALSVTVDRDVVPEGLSPAALVRIRGNRAGVGAVDVTLTSSDPGEAVVPALVVLPAGDAEVVVPLDSVDDGVSDGSRTVTLTASAAGFVPGSDVVVVSDIQQPDLAIEVLTGPASGRTSAPFQVTFREVNRGLASATGSWRQALYLSDDPVAGNDELLGTVGFEGTLPPGLYFERTLQFRLPARAGTYWLVAVSDPDNTVAELLEGNNTTVAPVPVEVTPAYTAEVATSVETAPAGTPVPMEGRALLAGTQTPAPFEWVDIHVVRGEARRVVSALTDAAGRFTASFLPLPGEAGRYTIGAAHPGTASAPVQDAFTLLGMRFDPRGGALVLTGPGTVQGGFELENLSDVPLTGLVVAATGAPDWLDFRPSVPAGLPGDGRVTVSYVATGTRETAAAAEMFVEVRADGGLLARLPLSVRVEPRVPRVVAIPSRLEAGMLRGEQTLLALRLRNEGGAATGPLTLVPPPAFPWLAVASVQPLPSLAPGGEADITLRLSPDGALPLGRYEGSITVTAPGTATAVPFSFLALSTSVGSLEIETVDEFTYYAAGSPPLAGAQVRVVDELTGGDAAAGVTDAAGRAVFADLREGYYRVEVSASGHTSSSAVLLVPAGTTTRRTVFLSRNTVEYRWTVTPTEIEDRTRITVEAVFETVVPAPVVVVEPSVIDFAEFTADVSQVDLKVTNHGLIAAQDVRLNLPQLPGWILEPLVTDLGDLPARSAFTIPVVIRRRAAEGREAAPAAGVGCAAANLLYRLVCGPFNNTYSIPIGIHNDGSGCPAGGGGWAAAAAGGPGGSFTPPRAVSFDSKCGPGPCAAEIAKWSFDCAFSILPIKDGIKCAKGVYDCLAAAAQGGATGSTALTCLGTALDCAAAGGKSINPLVGAAVSFAQCADGMRSVAECLEKAKQEAEGGRLAAWDYDLPASLLQKFEILEGRLKVLSDHLVLYRALVGNEAWFHPGMDETFGVWFEGLQAAALPGTPLGERIDLAERQALTSGPVPPGIAASDLHRLIDRWNRTVDYYGRGIVRRSDLPAGENPDFIAFDEILAAAGRTRDAVLATESAGFDDPVVALQSATTDWVDAIKATGWVRFEGGKFASGIALPAAGPAPGDAGICARVRLRLDQEAVISRDAFVARLEVENRQGIPLRRIRVTLEVRDTAGVLANDRFGIRQPEVVGMGAVDGTGELGPDSTGTVAWTLIPTSDAAPDGPATYTVSGRLEYVEEGIAVVIPLAPSAIDVLPNASLAVRYFHQRDVLADDPFTPDIEEPSVPYSLAVLVENRGRGTARNVRIASAQPRIIENEKGLLVDFRILGTEVDGTTLSPSLTVGLGDVAPGATAVGRWLLESTLQGQFIEYDATFEHLDGLGDPRLSLIESVEIHELIRIVDGRDADPRPDFLANDLADDAFTPDTLHLSGGGLAPVSAVTDGTFDGAPSASRLEVGLTAAFPAGWGYLRVAEPSGGALVLAAVRRPDGSTVPAANVWVTDRTFIAGGRRPVYEHVLHLLDRDGPGVYTLVYAPPAPADTTAPESAVAALPAESGPRIPIAWAGADEPGGSGLDAFDIYVAVDRGPFEPWLRGTRATAATYVGEPGRAYAFFSVATDRAGNREADPGAPDTFTAATRTNRPPALGVPAPVRVDEGAVVRVPLVASDPDEPLDRIRFRLGADAPAGVQLDPVTGLLTWATGEGLGPATRRIPVEVFDDGIPPLSARAEVELEVVEVNSAPVLDPVADRRVGEGEAVVFELRASDPDLPANALRFRLLGEPPAGAAVDPVTGRFAWTPDSSQGGREHVFGVEVSDDGTPPASASRYFTVVVDDVLPDFRLLAGEGWALSGEEATSPLVLDSGQPLASVSFELELLGDPVPEPALVAVDPDLTGLVFQALGGGRFRVTLTADPGSPLAGNRRVADLVFPPLDGSASALVRIRLSGATAMRPTGSDPARGRTVGGYLVRVGEAPVLLAGLEDGLGTLRLFSLPGRPVDLERRDVLASGPGWEWVRSLTPASVETPVPDPGPPGFYRAVAGREPAPVLRIGRGTDGALILRPDRATSGAWVLETATSLGAGAVWSRLADVGAGDPDWSHTVPAPSDAERWYRLRRLP